MNVEVNCQSHAFLVDGLGKGDSYFTYAIKLHYLHKFTRIFTYFVTMLTMICLEGFLFLSESTFGAGRSSLFSIYMSKMN